MKYLAVLIFALLAVGCSNSTYNTEVGSGPITLSNRVQASFQEYLESNPTVFTVTQDGSTSWGYYYCPEFNGCRGSRQQSMAPAIKTCEKRSGGKPCKVYAIGRNIVWKNAGL